MPRATTKRGPRARHMNGVNRIEQAQRIQEIIHTMPVEDRVYTKVHAKLHDKGIDLSEPTVRNHMKRAAGNSGANNGEGGLLARVEAVSKALLVCGGVEGLNETIKLVKKIGKVLQ